MTLLSDGRVHFIGIGGAGMSAIAKVLIERHIPVTGSDLKRSQAATVLEAMGAAVHIGHDPSHVGGAGVVVVSSAIRSSNTELAAARAADIPVLTRGEALAALLAEHRSIVVAGTHGKTTTTSMIVSVLRAGGIDATYLVGAGLNDSGTNARSGVSDLAVAESDESDGSFLLLAPSVAVVTNVEEDHVDHWSSLDELRAAFDRFIGSAGSAVIIPASDEPLVAAARSTGRRMLTFGPGGDVQAIDITASSGTSSTFTLHAQGRQAPVRMRVPGLHNVSNALAAAAACLAVEVELAAVAHGLGRYAGVERRFHLRGEAAGISVIDDYAHHPTEVRATLEAARTLGARRVVACFQPHLYSRTRELARDFGRALALADLSLVVDIYPARERAKDFPGVSGLRVAQAAADAAGGRPVWWVPSMDAAADRLQASLGEGDVVLTLGAGDVNRLAAALTMEDT